MSSAHSSIPSNKMLAWSSGNGGRGYARIRFPFDLAWYNEQPSTKFLSFQHRKEANGFRHEFIALGMMDGSICRVERTGDPNALLHALTFQGSVAYDLIESFRPDELEKARLDTSSIVAEIYLRTELDLKDVLNICRAIQETGITRNYTLQTFNCYFFSLALQCCLTRLVAKWEEEIPYEAWNSVAQGTADSILEIGPMMHPLLRLHFILSSPLGFETIHQQRFLMEIQQHFRKGISNLRWAEIANGVYWHHELEITLDNTIRKELLTAWLKATASLRGLGEVDLEALRSDPISSIDPIDRLRLLALRSLDALWDVVEPPTSGDIQVPHISRRWRSNMHNSRDAHSQALVNQSDNIGQMECRDTMSDELEQALTILQWLDILWLHVKQAVGYILGLFVTLSMSLVWIPVFSRYTYIDVKLAHIASDLAHSDEINTNQLSDLLKTLYNLEDRGRRNATWKELPWIQVLAVIKKHPPSNSLLGHESASIAVSGAVCPETTLNERSPDMLISIFQQEHVLKRIEFQANLVQRVGLGSASQVSAEIQQRLSLVWATFRNDQFDAVIWSTIMTTDEVLSHLYAGGCNNISSKLDKAMVSRDPVARGAGADVYSGELYSGRRVALKCVRLAIGNEDRNKLKKTAHELYVWSKCKHPNVLELIGVTRYRNQVAVVSPWMHNGDLRTFLRLNPRADRHDLCVQMADGVAYLHEQTIVHGDIRGANILVSPDHVVKITDLGTSYVKHCLQEFAATRTGLSIRWAAPEILEENVDNSYEADVYALAMTILEAVTGNVPYDNISSNIVVMQNIIGGRFPTRPLTYIPIDYYGNILWSLLNRCWAYEGWKRPTAVELQNQLRAIMF